MKFETINQTIAEIAKDDKGWDGDDVSRIEDRVIKEMIEGDKDPFFVEFIALHETLSENKNEYTEDSVKSCVEAMLGVNMYKGHEQPGTEDWKYREPVGQVIASKLTTIEVGGKRVLAAKGKAYITEADPKLRSDIRKKMAGPVSVLGNAKTVRDLQTGIKKVTKINSLKSIDFCNPGTGGIKTCGVTAIVKEMSSAEDIEEQTMKLTKEQLVAEYGAEIKEIAAKYIDEDLKTVADEKKKVAEAQAALEKTKDEVSVKISEMQSLIDSEKKKIMDLQAALDSEKKLRLESELKVHVNAKISEMKSGKIDSRIIDVALENIQANIVDLDIEKSKNDFNSRIDKEVERLNKISEMFSKKDPKEDSSDTTKKSKNKDGGNRKVTLADIMNKSLAAAANSGEDNKK